VKFGVRSVAQRRKWNLRKARDTKRVSLVIITLIQGCPRMLELGHGIPQISLALFLGNT